MRTGARHFVCGDRGVSEWTFTGTRTDGTRVEMNGCDIFTFRDGKIALKNSLQCGVLAHGFVRLGCDTCPHTMLLAFSGKRRGFCPACAGRRMAQTAAHLVEQVIPWVPTRQWVVSVPIPLRYWMALSKELTAAVHTCPEVICKVFFALFLPR
jgi:hypothetical protein